MGLNIEKGRKKYHHLQVSGPQGTDSDANFSKTIPIELPQICYVSIETLIEVIKPIVTEKNVFSMKDIKILLGF